jgi:tRNA pseudouridine38-40 synthase
VRWRLDLAYDGTDFAGWAVQAGGQRTVQGELELWTPRVLRLDRPVTLVCAGRTDAGVHARGQVAHLDLAPAELTDPAVLHRRLARVLRDDLVVRRISAAPAGFHARFGAIWRRYVYRLWDGPTGVDPLLRRQVTRLRSPLDLDPFNAAAAGLLGLRDFAAFCRRRPGATTIRTLLELEAVRVPDGPLAGVVEVTVRADAFCHSMVRAVVGALTEVGAGRRGAAWLAELADARERRSGVPVLPAHGLTLEEVGYPPDEELAARAAEAQSLRTLPRKVGASDSDTPGAGVASAQFPGWGPGAGVASAQFPGWGPGVEPR